MSLRRRDSGVDLSGLRGDVLRDLRLMAAEYFSIFRVPIVVNSAFRSFGQQADLVRRLPGVAAEPGRSMHNYGYAFDIDGVIVDKLERSGLLKKYRFRRPVVSEPWHVERSGIVYDAVRRAGAVGALVAIALLAMIIIRK